MRRDFIKTCALAGLGVAAPIGVSVSGRAQTREPEAYEGPFYVVFNASGGWDTTYLMDPKGVNEINRLYQEEDILTQGVHRFAPTKGKFEKGASNEEFFATYGSEIMTLNGIDYSVNNHSPCMRYMATGKLDSLEFPTFAALVAACHGSDCPLAFLTFGNYSGTGNVIPMSRVPYLPTLKLIANADAVQGQERSPYFDDFALDRIEQTLKAHNDSRLQAAGLPRQVRAQSMLFAAQLNSKSLKRVTPFIPEKLSKERLHQQTDIALAAFKGGVCVSANLNIGQFDSHANNDRDQLKLIPEFLDGIDYFMKRAEELGIREKVTVIIQSEMGRTPNYNQGDGKDHWSIGSIMFMGNGITGNRVIGKTDDGQFLIPVDPQSLQLNETKGIRIRPEHIHLELRKLAGIDQHTLSKKFPLKVPENEKLSSLWG